MVFVEQSLLSLPVLLRAYHTEAGVQVLKSAYDTMKYLYHLKVRTFL